MPPRLSAREESWQSLHLSEASADNEDSFSTDVSMDDGADVEENTLHMDGPPIPTVMDIRKSLHPLRDIAERVGHQVEEFAKSLDRVISRTKDRKSGDCRFVIPFVKEYQRIANETVKTLKSAHGSEKRRESSRRSKSRSERGATRSPGAGRINRSGSEGHRGTTLEDLKWWEQEEQTWDLLDSMLQVEFPVSENDRHTLERNRKDAPALIRPTHNLSIHRYSSENEVWKNFLATDDLAWERHTVSEWLKSCANKSRPDIDEIVEELESEADRGSGLWAHSWLFTKEAIKGQKRLRSWPQALEPDSPGLDTSLIGSTHKTALVSQLDPDAISRQGRKLEKQDTSFERAIWVACWEMLRRGKSWDYVQNWCRDRGELWRSTAMRSDLHFQATSSGWQSRQLWRKACAVTAKGGSNDDYEQAVYGVLSGYLPSVLSIGQGWDDFLFAHYNSYLLHSYERHLYSCYPDRVIQRVPDILKSSAFSGQRVSSGNQIIENMKLQPDVKDEALQPLKMLQGALISKNFEEFIIKHGVRITRVANTETESKTIQPLSLAMLEDAQTAPITLEDYDFLRILTHIIIIFSNMGYNFGRGDGKRRYAVDSIIVAYINFLSQAGKQQLVPLYASHLSPMRIINCMGRQLPYVVDADERRILMKLMTQYGINVPAVLAVQLVVIMNDFRSTKSFPQLEILEPNKSTAPLLHEITPRFIGSDVSVEDADLIHGLEWFMLLDGHWLQSTFYGAEVYKYFLKNGRLAAGRTLSREVTFSKFSLAKSQGILGWTTDISDDRDFSDDEESPLSPPHKNKSRRSKAYRSRPSGSSGQSKLKREVLLGEGRSFLDFEHLFNALDAIETWKELAIDAERYTNRQQDRMAWIDRKGPFQKAFNEVELTVTRLMHGWLQSPRNDTEAKEFLQIRTACLPEIILAYNSILNFSSRYLSRNLLLKSMNLASLIASEEPDLSACIVEAERMPELVESFAMSSKNMIMADGTSAGRSKGRRKRDGETLDLWTVKPQAE